MYKYLIIFIFFSMAFTKGLFAQTENDTLAIKSCVLDYVDSWWEGDAERMSNSLHPDLAKRSVYRDRNAEKDMLSHSTKYALVEYTRAGGGTNSKEPKGNVDVLIYDVEGNNAAVKVWSNKYWDYLHLVKWNGKWVILDVLWGFMNNY